MKTIVLTKHQSSRGTKLMLYKGSKGLFLCYDINITDKCGAIVMKNSYFCEVEVKRK
ncbi:hypothetical protein C5L31_002162 [Secundilactobacillus malefermentans]|uniref:Uncharacterized protein n=1 Tax=Secundilactobacillus malefermentans TaxID=176292 RepID=A0A4R5NT25_9LACO|nr:hypothetical protein C5L31_002162 [Secundilactobacillus malefermentans]